MNQQAKKGLEEILKKSIKEEEALSVQIKELQRQWQKKSDTNNELRKKIQEMAIDREPCLSDHAIVRYLERERPCDLDDIKSIVFPEQVKSLIKKLGDGKFPSGHLTLVVKDNVVVTVY